MFKMIIVILLCIIAFKSCAVDVIMANVPFHSKGYIFVTVNDYHNMFTVPFNIPVYHWSY